MGGPVALTDMCGICGVIQVGGDPRTVVPPEVLDRMTDAMTHRGPDDRGVHVAAGVAIGVRRLSVVDVEGGHQPFSDESGRIWAAQNGELYNHVGIRRELADRGHRFRSRCDTEVIPHLYEEHGPAFPARLRGMFGIVLWDDRRRRAVLARDRLGIKPLYYARAGDLLVFASELKSLLASGLVEPRLDVEAIDAYLSLGFVPGPRTPLEGVRKLPPGHVLVVGDGRVREEAFWSYPPPAPGPDLGVDHYAERLLAELEDSVRMRLMADVPLGAMLSGGLDSSLIVALMARNMSGPVTTFSVGFAEDREGNELADARMVASAFGAEHHELELSFREQAIDVAELVWHLDEPLADLSALGFIALCELARKHVTVALSGQGADELLGGYPKHKAASLVGEWRRVPGPLRGAGERLVPLAPARLRRAARTLAAPEPAARLLEMSGHFDAGLRARLARGPLAELDGRAAHRAALARMDGLVNDPLPAALHLDAQLGLVNDMLHYFDRTSMAHSLEVRVPFLDHEVVEFCATIPAGLKVRRLTTKHVLKHAARGIVPDRVIDKPKIGFFKPAVDAWFRSQAEGAIADYLLDPSPRYADLLDRAEVGRMVGDYLGGGGGGGRTLLSIMMLEVWLSTYLPRATGAPPARETVRLSA